MTKLSLLVLLAAAACGSNKKPSSPATSEALVKIGEFKTRMCACKDVACAMPVLKDFNTWTRAYQTSPAAQEKMSSDDTQELDTLTAAMQTCANGLAKAAGAGSAGSAVSAP
jgi:hypothetical protein